MYAGTRVSLAAATMKDTAVRQAARHGPVELRRRFKDAEATAESAAPGSYHQDTFLTL